MNDSTNIANIYHQLHLETSDWQMQADPLLVKKYEPHIINEQERQHHREQETYHDFGSLAHRIGDDNMLEFDMSVPFKLNFVKSKGDRVFVAGVITWKLHQHEIYTSRPCIDELHYVNNDGEVAALATNELSELSWEQGYQLERLIASKVEANILEMLRKRNNNNYD